MSVISISAILAAITLFGAFAGFFLKLLSDQKSKKDFLISPYFYAGGFLYLCAAAGNIVLLKILPYSIVLPLTSITYVWTLFIARIFLKERINGKKIIGVFLIISGAFFIGIQI